MILRNHQGEFCSARNLRKDREVSVFEAESYGILEAIKWVIDLGISNVVIESDSLLAVQAIKRGSEYYLEVGNILQEVRTLLEERHDIYILFVKKQANKVAHMLARVPCEANCLNDFSSPPHMVLESILYDVLMN